MNSLSDCNVVKQLTALALTITATVAHGVENGAPITPFGVNGFGAGMLPPSSVDLAVGVRLSAYSADELRDTNGNPSAVRAKLKVSSAALALVETTDISLLGGEYGFSAVIPYLDMSNRLTVPAPTGVRDLDGSSSALGDVTLVPVIVKWTPSSRLFVNGRLELQLPTGSYKADRLINTGANHWTVSPALAFTWISENGLEVSSNMQLSLHGKNKDTQYRSGTEYQHEFAVGQHLGPWVLGLGGYVYRQVSDDKADGARFQDGNRSRVRHLHWLRPRTSRCSGGSTGSLP
jgi:hypothetical protein